MQPRLLFRTHYQVDEPVYMEILVKFCTTGVRSEYSEVIAARVAKQIRAHGISFNVVAGRYAVDLGQALGILSENNTWTEKGFLVDIVADVTNGVERPFVHLTTRQRMLHFRLFFEADGAALLFLVRHLLTHGSIPAPGKSLNDLAKEMFVEIFSGYLALTNNTSDRVKLRNSIDQLSRKNYEGNTGRHKLLLHAQTLHRLGLAEREEGAARIHYSLPESCGDLRGRLASLCHEVSSLSKLESLISSNTLVEVAAKTLGVPFRDWTQELYGRTVALAAGVYNRIGSSGIPLCPISTIIEATQIFLVSDGVILDYSRALHILLDLQRQFPKGIRLHVDRRGQPAFIKMSDAMVERLGNNGYLM
jgi:hypothetical protein